jgi:hypothetical protein
MGAAQSPLVLFEFGLNGDEWWKKFDQGVRYLERLCSTPMDGKCEYCLDQPALLVIDNRQKDDDVKMGILLVAPRRETKDTGFSILWQAETHTLDEKQCSEGCYE